MFKHWNRSLHGKLASIILEIALSKASCLYFPKKLLIAFLQLIIEKIQRAKLLSWVLAFFRANNSFPLSRNAN